MKQLNFSFCRFTLPALAALLFSLNLCAQNKRISGKVTDNVTHYPLEGITVSTKTFTVITNTMGEYTISFDKGDKLALTYIGYQPRAVSIGDNAILDVSLLPSAVQLNDVVVTAVMMTSMPECGY